MKAKNFAAILIALSLYGCITTPEKYGASKVSYEQWKEDRKNLPAQIEHMLSAVKAEFEAKPNLFDGCFTESSGKKIGGKGLLRFTLIPSDGKLALDDFSSPEALTGLAHENFGHCADMVLAKMQISPDPSVNSRHVYHNFLKVIWPSWEISKSNDQTEIKPAGFFIRNNAVCIRALHQFSSVSPWDVWKQGSQYFSDNYQKLDENEILLCSGLDLKKALPFDEAAIRRQYPSIGDAAVVDGI